MNRVTSIYALVHPVTNEVRYVGKTVNVNRRIIQHRHDIRNHKYRKVRWMQSILPLEPELIVLEEVTENWQEAEQFWIAYMKSLGADLTNHTDGGEGNINWHPSDESRAKMSESHKGKVIPDEVIAKMSAAKIGKFKSDETRANMSVAQTGRVASEEQLINMSIAGKANWANPEFRSKVIASLTGRTAANKDVPMKEEQKVKVSEGLKRYNKEMRENGEVRTLKEDHRLKLIECNKARKGSHHKPKYIFLEENCIGMFECIDKRNLKFEQLGSDE